MVTGSGPVRLTAWVRGHVQGVGMRWWIRSRVLELGLAGSARNLDDGRVEVVAEGPRTALEQLLELLGSGGAPGRVSGVSERWSDARGMSGFEER
jgi:acylphosphatase